MFPFTSAGRFEWRSRPLLCMQIYTVLPKSDIKHNIYQKASNWPHTHTNVGIVYTRAQNLYITCVHRNRGMSRSYMIFAQLKTDVRVDWSSKNKNNCEAISTYVIVWVPWYWVLLLHLSLNVMKRSARVFLCRPCGANRIILFEARTELILWERRSSRFRYPDVLHAVLRLYCVSSSRLT